MSIINSQPRIGAAGQSTGYKIERSLRFNSADSAYLSRTPSSSSNRKTWTWSAWVKLSKVDGTWQSLFSAYTTSDAVGDRFEFNYENLGSGPVLYAQINQSSVTFFVTNAVYRDPSAWYHIVLAVDTTQASPSNQFKLYINGVQQTFSSNNGVTQNTDLAINRNIAHAIGRREKSTTEHFSGYMTEVNFIDGSTPTTTTRTVGGVTETILTQFGEFDTDTGVWKPKAYSGSYGTNGFYLKFADNSGTTSTTLGKDSSGNGNNWTPNNFYVGPGTTNAEKAGIDSLVDTPTPYGTDTGAGGEVRGNYCTLNPLNNPANSTLTNGNLDVTTASSTGGRVVGTVGVSSGKWYWEITPTSVAGQSLIGIAAASRVSSGGVGDFSDDYAYQDNGNKYSNSVGAAYGASYTANDVIGVALDLDAGTLVFYKNNSSQGTAYSSISGTFVPAMSDGQNANSSTFVCNFGQRPFAYTAPSGFKALCTQNLPTPTIGATSATRADDYFNTVLYTGNGNTSSNAITGVGFQPDFVWIKARSQPYEHNLLDAVRGPTKLLFSSLANAESTTVNFNSFDSDGFNVDSEGGGSAFNENNTTYVAWNWKANGAGSTSHTQGSISSTASVNQTAGFSIVTYTGNATAGATIGHGLGATPSMIIVKDRVATSGAREWVVYHSSLGNTKAVFLSTTGAAYTGTNLWNNTSPTSAVFTVGNSSEGTNGSGNAMLAYCFAPVAGYSAFGSYVANGSTDGNFIYTDMAPKFVLIKCSSTAENWVIFDTARDTYNVAGKLLRPNLGDAELDSPPRIDILSNGFKIRASGTSLPNTSGATYIYMALAANPFKYSLAR